MYNLKFFYYLFYPILRLEGDAR